MSVIIPACRPTPDFTKGKYIIMSHQHAYHSPMDNDSMDQDFQQQKHEEQQDDLDIDYMLQDDFQLESTLMPQDDNPPGLERGGSSSGGGGHGGKSHHSFSARGVFMGRGGGGEKTNSTTILHQDFKKRFKAAEMAMDPTFKVSSI